MSPQIFRFSSLLFQLNFIFTMNVEPEKIFGCTLQQTFARIFHENSPRSGANGRLPVGRQALLQ